MLTKHPFGTGTTIDSPLMFCVRKLVFSALCLGMIVTFEDIK
jgi:hypothetical protein